MMKASQCWIPSSPGLGEDQHHKPCLQSSWEKQCQTVVKTSSPRRLKVIRELEAGISPSCAGRMVISGRMADVCAELDRLAQKESLLQAD